ncbi:MAG TPA: metallophosphoesterase [Chitinophagaceae bacterium]|nr:metallophosphoesterase [Chitinophagaceae bacterium]
MANKSKIVCRLVIAVLLFSTTARSQPKYAVIEAEVKMTSPTAYDSVHLLPVYFNEIKPGMNVSVETVRDGKLRCVFMCDSPFLVRKMPLLEGQAFLIEPGDSISVRKAGGILVFSGHGFEKVYIRNRLTEIIKEIPLPANNSYLSTDSTSDYLQYYNYNKRVLDRQLKIIDSISGGLSKFAYAYERSRCVIDYIWNICQKFLALKNNKKISVSPKVLSELYNSTICPSMSMLGKGDVSALPGMVGSALEAYCALERARAANWIDNKSVLEKYVETYRYAKKYFTGLYRERVLTQLLTLRMFKKYPGEQETIACANDYLSLPGYTEYKNNVRKEMITSMTLAKGMPAPDFALVDVNGKPFSSTSLKRKLIVMDFWFTGCKGCIQMAPALRKLEDEFKDRKDVVFINVSIDKDRGQWLQSIAQKKYTSGGGINLYTGGLGESHSLIERYNVKSYPLLQLIDFSSRLYGTVPDPRINEAKDLITVMKQLLAVENDGPYVSIKPGWSIIERVQLNNGVRRVLKDSVRTDTLSRLKLKTGTDDPKMGLIVGLKKVLAIEPCEFEKPSKYFVCSDIEGNFSALRKLLQANQVIDEKYNWIFGKGHLVFAGDMFDRGDQVTECLWLIYSLEEKARAAGGYVHFILGNHDIMNLQGDHRYTQKKYIENADLLHKKLSDLYSQGTCLGKWLRTKNVIEKIGDIIFCHAGISPELTRLNIQIPEINAIAREYYDNRGTISETKARVVLSTKVGLFWYRDYYLENPMKVNIGLKGYDTIYKTPQVEIEKILILFGAKQIVTGHTIVADTISVWYDGKVINTDTKHAEGKSEALLIERDHFYRVNDKGERKLLVIDDNSNNPAEPRRTSSRPN